MYPTPLSVSFCIARDTTATDSRAPASNIRDLRALDESKLRWQEFVGIIDRRRLGFVPSGDGNLRCGSHSMMFPIKSTQKCSTCQQLGTHAASPLPRGLSPLAEQSAIQRGPLNNSVRTIVAKASCTSYIGEAKYTKK